MPYEPVPKQNRPPRPLRPAVPKTPIPRSPQPPATAQAAGPDRLELGLEEVGRRRVQTCGLPDPSITTSRRLTRAFFTSEAKRQPPDVLIAIGTLPRSPSALPAARLLLGLQVAHTRRCLGFEITALNVWDHGDDIGGQRFNGDYLSLVPGAKTLVPKLGSLLSESGSVNLKGCNVGMDEKMVQKYANWFGRTVTASTKQVVYGFGNYFDIGGLCRYARIQPFSTVTKKPQTSGGRQ